jgi:hypothetical protein
MAHPGVKRACTEIAEPDGARSVLHDRLLSLGTIGVAFADDSGSDRLTDTRGTVTAQPRRSWQPCASCMNAEAWTTYSTDCLMSVPLICLQLHQIRQNNA